VTVKKKQVLDETPWVSGKVRLTARASAATRFHVAVLPCGDGNPALFLQHRDHGKALFVSEPESTASFLAVMMPEQISTPVFPQYRRHIRQQDQDDLGQDVGSHHVEASDRTPSTRLAVES
jgi:hypothetical protein